MLCCRPSIGLNEWFLWMHLFEVGKYCSRYKTKVVILARILASSMNSWTIFGYWESLNAMDSLLLDRLTDSKIIFNIAEEANCFPQMSKVVLRIEILGKKCESLTKNMRFIDQKKKKEC